MELMTKRGRPRKDEARRKTVLVRLTDDEHQMLLDILDSTSGKNGLAGVLRMAARYYYYGAMKGMNRR